MLTALKLQGPETEVPVLRMLVASVRSEPRRPGAGEAALIALGLASANRLREEVGRCGTKSKAHSPRLSSLVDAGIMATSSDLDYEVVFPESTTLAAKCTTAQATIGPGKQTLLLPAAAPGAPKAIKVQNVAGENVKAARALSPNSNFSPLALVILADIAQSNGVIDAEALPLVRDAIMRCSAAELAALRLHTLLVRPEDDAAALWLPADDCTASEEGKPVLASPRIESVRTKICFINLRDCAIDCAWVAFNGQEDNGCKQNQARPWRVLPGHQLDISSGA